MNESSAAFNRGDLDGHLAVYALDTTTMTLGGPVPGREAMKQGFPKQYFGPDGKPFQELSFDQFVVHAIGEDHAYSTGHFALRGGGRPERSGWFTLVWGRQDGGWRILHNHSS